MKPFFEKQLNDMVIADIQQREYIGRFADTNLRHCPVHLYKFRNCQKDHNFTMIGEGYLWGDKPVTFDDPFDSLINHKLKSELPFIQKWLYHHLGEILYYSIPPKGMQPRKKGLTRKKFIEAQKRFTDSAGRYSAHKARKIMVVETKKLHPVKQRELQKVYDSFESPEFEKKMEEDVQNCLLKVVQALREKALVCSLTLRKDNQKMWEEYADKYSGFVIEYDLSAAVTQPEATAALTRVFPVTYHKRLPKVPLLPFIEREFYKKFYGRDTDIRDAAKKLYKQLLVKREEYGGEEEWRIISSTQRIGFPVISAVYMGKKIEDVHAQRLADICARKQIPLYKQEFDPLNGRMNFVRVVE